MINASMLIDNDMIQAILYDFFISYVGYAVEGAPYLLSPSVPFSMFKINIYKTPIIVIYHNKFNPLLLTSCKRLTVTEIDGIKSSKLYATCKTPYEVGSIGL